MFSIPISRYEIMKSCWSLKPRERPTFQHLVGQFTSILEKTSGYLELSQAPSLLDFRWKDTSPSSHPPPSSPPAALPVLQEQEEPEDGNEDEFWNEESALLMCTQVKILLWHLPSKSVCVYFTWSSRVAQQLSDTITRTQPFHSDQTELAILATFSTSEGVTQQACTVPASAEG